MKKNNLWSIIRQYGVKSVFFRYITSSLTISLLVFIPFALVIFIYYDYVRTQELSRQSTINVLQSKNLFESLTSDFHTNYKLACNSHEVMNFINSPSADMEQIEDVRDFIQDILSNSVLIDEIYIFSCLNEQSVSSAETVTLGDNNYYEWYRTYRSTRLPFLMFPRQNEKGIFDKLYIYNEIYDDQELMGILCMEMNYNTFSSIIQDSFIIDPERIFVVSDIGLVLYSDAPELINHPMQEREDTYAAFESVANVEGNSIIYGNHIITVARSTQSQLMIMSYIPKNTYQINNRFIYILIISSCVAILFLSFFLALFFSFRQYRSVANVMNTLDAPGELHSNNELINEFFYIASSISDISQQNKVISDELSEKICQLKKAQVATLQAQINPHFLFNTLQLINLSIIKEVKRDNMATFLISQLAALLRSAYDTERYIIPVSEELEITQQYLSIQQARYKSQLEITTHVQPECLDCQTIKLLLQPLVENSILHGFKGKDTPWHISISCCLEDDYLVYKIVDNGWGIEKSRLDALNEALLSDKIYRDEKVGVANVNLRLKLVFGRGCGITIDSAPQTGTTITIRHCINPILGIENL